MIILFLTTIDGPTFRKSTNIALALGISWIQGTATFFAGLRILLTLERKPVANCLDQYRHVLVHLFAGRAILLQLKQLRRKP